METQELIQSGFNNVKRTMDRTLNGLTPAEILWHPKPDANSIAIILFHMGRDEDSTVQSRLQNKPALWESENWYVKLGKEAKDNGGHYTAEQVAAFSVPDTADLLKYLEVVRNSTLEYLKNVAASEFDRRVTLPFGPPGRPPMEVSIGSMLLMIVTHLAQHVGEISYLRGLQRGINK